ncbi:MAG: DUF3037 domain-containing protein [Solirubrobacterales bacterium]
MAAEPRPFAYAVLRVIPCVERGESLNAGVALFCRQFDFLELKVSLDPAKLAAIAPDADREAIDQRLEEIRGVIEGDPARGTLAEMDPSDRFGWLVAPSSTVIQASEAHTGLTTDPAAELRRLFESLVL